MNNIDTLSRTIDQTINSLELHKYLAIEALKIPVKNIDVIDSILHLYKPLNEAIKNKNGLPENHINNIRPHLIAIYNSLPYRECKSKEEIFSRFSGTVSEEDKADYLGQIFKQLKPDFEASKFKLSIFLQLDFFENNIVLIGANGSGKTTLANNLKQAFNSNNGIVISAQRYLKISQYMNIESVTQTRKVLDESRSRDKTYKNPRDYNFMHDEFDRVMRNLIADHVSEGLKYSIKSKSSLPEKPSPKTNLDHAIEIWNSLIGHREIAFADDHINLVASTKEGVTYELLKMSEGEKVMLYLIAQVLQAPQKGFVIVDEPEIFLHRAILKKLWTCLENIRKDCIFIYLTHDIQFAASRETAQKVWIRSYKPPQNWDFEAVNTNELPEDLLLEILGSHKKILFCEGSIGGDEVIYNILFPNFTIKPVGSCKNVIDYTKAYNRIPNRLSDAFGIIDADFRGEDELNSLRADNIYSMDIAEIENLILDEALLCHCASCLHCDNGEVEKIKTDILSKFKDDIEMQTSHYIINKINHIFRNSHVRNANTISEVQREYDIFVNQIDIQDWTKSRKNKIEEIAASNNYCDAIKYYNNKGLITIVEQVFGKKNFKVFAIKELRSNNILQDQLRMHICSELLSQH